MKNITLFVTALCLSSLGFSQSAFIQLSEDSICAGESVTAEAFAPQYALATSTGTNNQNGVMFDVTATYAAEITGFLISPLSSNSTFYIYYRTGTHVGHENSSSGWTMLDSVTGVPAGTDVNPGFNINQPIVAGQTLAFYITSNGTNYMYYDNGTSVGTTLASDSYLTIKEGVGKAYPFANTYTTRNFVGSVLYSPSVTTYAWNTNNSGSSITKSPNKSSVYGCTMTLSSGSSVKANAAVLLKEIGISASATPASINAGQSSTLNAEVAVHRGLATTQVGGNNQSGAMFDVVASKSLEITGFTVTPLNTDADIEISYKTGTHVGFEGNSNAWTSIGTYSNVTGAPGQYLALNSPISMVAGQTIAFYITRTDVDYLSYSNGTGVGTTVVAGGGLKILEGTGVAYPFGNTYPSRILNSIVHFTVDPITNAAFSWSSGGSSASVVVSPTNTTTYDVDVTLGGCTETESVTVTVGGIGLDEQAKANFNVYPNPASDYFVIEFANTNEETYITLTDLTGKTVYTYTATSGLEELIIPVNTLSKGLYLLRLEQKGSPVFYKIDVL